MLSIVETKRKNNIEEQIAEYYPKLKSFIRNKMKDGDDADDILQDVWFQFVQTVNVTANPIGNISAWLYRVARNAIINFGMKHREQAMPAHYDTSDQDDVMTGYLHKMVWEELDIALAELPPEQRAAFELTELDGIPVKVISDTYGIPVATLNSRKYYAVQHLRKRLRSLYDGLRYE